MLSGFAAGAFYSNIGGGSNYLCLPHNPEYNKYSDAAGGGEISGVEYETNSGIFRDSANEQNVPCAQCLSKRSVAMMLPARRTCPKSWTKEYEGRKLFPIRLRALNIGFVALTKHKLPFVALSFWEFQNTKELWGLLILWVTPVTYHSHDKLSYPKNDFTLLQLKNLMQI